MLAVALLALGTSRPVHAQATAYLPLNLEPEMERQVERVLILADEPILKRPFPVELVKLALPQACRVDHVLCRRVTRYLERYSRDYAVTHASITGSYTHNGAADVVPNEYGLTEKSHYDLSIASFVQPNDYMLASAGAVSYSGRTVPVGSMLTLGTRWAQIDIGWRPHWLSPLTDSSALISTEAPTTPSITLSNWEPLTRMGFQYEFFLTKLSSQPILYHGVQEGEPKLFGSQLSIEPFPGWSVGINRMLEFGGGSGLPNSPGFVVKQYFVTSDVVQLQGNQQASYVTRYVSPTRVPFAMYFQYAGENTSLGGPFLFGDPMMSGGIDFPRVFKHFDVTYEVAEWSDNWYTHFVFLHGMTQDGLVLGAWGADQRNFGDAVGARSQMLRVGWSPPFGGYLEEKVRLLTNQNYFGGDNRGYTPGERAYPYHHYVDVSVRYTRPWNGLTLGGEAEAGHDVFGENFARLSGFVRYGGDSHTRDEVDNDSDNDDAEHEAGAATPPQGAEWFVDVGGNVNRVVTAIAPIPPTTSSPHVGADLGFGVRRAVSEHNDFGARVEYDGGVDGHYLIGFRAFDWRYRFDSPLAIGAFAGFARYSTITPATSLYAGLGVEWRDIWRHWDLDLDGRFGDNLARDHVLATDFRGTRPETFYRIQSLALYLSRHF